MGYPGTRYTQDFKDNAVLMYKEIRNAKKSSRAIRCITFCSLLLDKKSKCKQANRGHQPIAPEHGARQ